MLLDIKESSPLWRSCHELWMDAKVAWRLVDPPQGMFPHAMIGERRYHLSLDRVASL